VRLLRAAGAAVLLTTLLAGAATAGAGIDLSITKTDSPDPVVAGTNLTWTITLENPGPGPVVLPTIEDTLPPGTTFVSFTAPFGWFTTTPPVGGTGTVTAVNSPVDPGSYVFTLVVQVGAGVAPGTVITNSATVTAQTTDPEQSNNSATAATTVAAAATPAASLADAAMPEPTGTSPVIALGMAALLLAGLAIVAVASGRRHSA
jgi:uncharacterized repeat protein (TIGR01451 family)